MCDVCNGMTMEQFRRQTLARIAANDYTMIGVAEERSRARWNPAFTYSIGLWSFRQVPEVIVVGAQPDHAAQMIERYAERADANRQYLPGSWHECLVPQHPVVFEQVARCHYHEWFAMAFDFYPDGDFPALQMLWPGPHGRWPWQAGWQRHSRIPPQPLLTASGRPESFSPDLDWAEVHS